MRADRGRRLALRLDAMTVMQATTHAHYAEQHARAERLATQVRNMQLVEADVRAEYLRFEQRALAAEAELKAVEAFRAAPLKTIRDLLGDHDSPDEAVAGAVCAILLTRNELARRKREAEAQVAALREGLGKLLAYSRRVCTELCEDDPEVEQAATLLAKLLGH